MKNGAIIQPSAISHQPSAISHQPSAHIYTFWEPKDKIPYYIQLCIETWKKFLPGVHVTILDNNTLKDYIDSIGLYSTDLLSGKFSLPQISDAVRVMLLEKNAGIWFDADTVILSKNASAYLEPPSENEVVFFGIPNNRGIHIAFINASPNARCMRLWAEYVRDRIKNFNPTLKDFWSYFGNSFINVYARAFTDEIKIIDRKEIMPELSSEPVRSTQEAYLDFYFLQKKHLTDINSSMLFLHNSWTPAVFRAMDKNQLLSCNCTLANVLAETLELDRSGIQHFTSFHTKSWRKIFGDKFVLHV